MMADITEEQFWFGIKILISNYHAVNRRIFDCLIIKVERINHGISNLSEKLNDENFWKYENENDNSACCISNSTMEELQNYLQNDKERKNKEKIKRCEGFKIKFKLLTKKLQYNIDAIGLVDFTESSYHCKFRDREFIDFLVRYEENNFSVSVVDQTLAFERNAFWADNFLMPKLLKWCQNAIDLDDDYDAHDGEDDIVKNSQTIATSWKSLQLVDKEKYNDLYKFLKQKHAKQAIELWHSAKESTDPLKFIYEDLAIASYLITLWHCTKTEPRAFADLGCGNGLLVYILNAEGYTGYGYDIRSRKLWSYFANNVQLIEESIMPDNFELPPEVDWLIGNHSDELSAWLPVMSSLASYEMRFFLLPCCAFEFSGAKFQRRNTRISTYQDFLQYTAKISEKSGFKVHLDRLKIPSTKRCAIIGLERTYSKSEHDANCQQLQEFVQAERLRYSTATPEIIKLREKTISVHNCTQMDKEILNDLVLKIFDLLLNANKHFNVIATRAEEWNTGGLLTLRQIATGLSSVDLKNLKSECGGLKTLLRNKHEIFMSYRNDLYGIRHPTRRKNNKVPKTIKKRMCFFKQHHPFGCPLSDEDCTFKHE